MRKCLTSELLPRSILYYCCRGQTLMIKTYFIIILLLVLSCFLSAQSINNHTQNSSKSDWKFLGLENEGITAIEVDWVNTNTIYAGSGSDFSSGTVGGIFKTTDAGASWDTLIRGVTVRDLDIHP